MVKQAVGSMSSGEKARLVLCMIVWQRPNLLQLDEPTNHPDDCQRYLLDEAKRQRVPPMPPIPPPPNCAQLLQARPESMPTSPANTRPAHSSRDTLLVSR